MFNLLRRSTKRKKQNKQKIKNNEKSNQNSASDENKPINLIDNTKNNRERYRQFSENEREMAADILPKRAIIAQSEDLFDSEDEALGEKQKTTSTSCSSIDDASGAGGKYSKSYFENRRRHLDGVRERQQINLAKTNATNETDQQTFEHNSAIISNKQQTFKNFDANNIVTTLNSSSLNELAEWQQQQKQQQQKQGQNTLKNGNLIDENSIERGQLAKQFDNQLNTLAVIAKNANKLPTTTATNIQYNCQQQQGTATTAETVINEPVKLRNKSHENSKKSETKRKSRLSLTLGLTNSKNKSSINENQILECEKPTRKSFFSTKSPKIPVTEQLDSENIDKNRKSKANRDNSFNTTDTTNKKLRPLQKSKEFLSDIFMARGRNHNRNKTQQQQPPQQQQQQLQSKTHQSKCHNQHPPQIKEKPSTKPTAVENFNKHNTDATDKTIHHNNTMATQQTAHLETNSDPAATVSTNSYQMTKSNNSIENANQNKLNEEQPTLQKTHNEQEFSARIPNIENNNNSATEIQQSLVKQNIDDQTVTANETVIRAADIAENGTTTANYEEEVQQTDRQDQNNSKKSDSESETNYCALNGLDADYEKERQLNELTECDRDNLLKGKCASDNHQNVTSDIIDNDEKIKSAHENQVIPPIIIGNVNNLNNKIVSNTSTNNTSSESMGQTNGKNEQPRSRESSTPRDFRESFITDEHKNNIAAAIVLPTITVADYSNTIHKEEAKKIGLDAKPIEQEVFYDFDSAEIEDKINITTIDDDNDDGIENDSDDNDDNDDDNDDVFHDELLSNVYTNKWPQMHMRHKLENVPEQEEENENDNVDVDERNLDNELYSNQYDSPERSPLKSTNTSDSNLSTSYPDSGISDLHSSKYSSQQTNDNEMQFRKRTTTSPLNQYGSQSGIGSRSSPFIRDGNSTDCDETLLQYDDLDYVTEDVNANELSDQRLVCIESISLPDVVMESKNNTTNSNSSNTTTTSTATNASDREIININGATGNSIGNVHFIPIQVEGSNNDASSTNQIKRRSVDDSVIGSSANKRSFAQFNGQSNTSIEIVEEECNVHTFGSNVNAEEAEKLKYELAEQKLHFNTQLEDAQKNVFNLQANVDEMQIKIEKLEQELSTKAWNVERLQGELNAAHKDDEFVRKKLKLLEDEKTNLRHKYSENEDEFKQKYEELQTRYKELEEKYTKTHDVATNLQEQLTAAQKEAEEWRQDVEKIRTELEEQTRILGNALENSEAERKICEDRWQKEFEMLRTQNQDREETLMTDCEWQLRQMQRQCKDKIDKVEHARQQALEKTRLLGEELEDRQQEIDDLKSYEAEVKSLRGVVSEQEQSIQSLMTQIENLKADLSAANENLEEQIEAVKKIKYQCDNALYDKERQTIYKIDEVRFEAASFWEDKLYSEMTRLKNELESVYVDERREALDKLQNEHIEELRALTTRYTANEEELRTELAELQERLDNRNEEFLELREKSDSTLLQTRMHLDRADREYQNAMCREEERRETLEITLRKEFETEKEEMEEKFRERLGQVKDEFARELQISSQEMSEQHKKQLEQQRVKLQSEKDEALQELIDRHRKKMQNAEEQMKDIELHHQRNLKDLKAAYDAEKVALDKRDISNANEIEQLHRKCRCLTNLFEEMRMRYERRDPRQEDLREIAELRNRCQSQERDLYLLTDRLREMQIQMSNLQQNGEVENQKQKPTKIKKKPPKSIPTNCDVIYEENEERESPPPTPSTPTTPTTPTSRSQSPNNTNIINNKFIEMNGKEHPKNIDTINEDDSHMITSV